MPRRSLPDDGLPVVRFEITCARVMPPPADGSENKSVKKYVVYEITIRQDSTRANDINPITFERRYTDFLKLYETLRKEYAAATNEVIFPKKVFMGNFSSELISERSAAFEAFLDFIVSRSDLRESPSFLNFLQGIELTKACQLLDERRNELAVPILEDCFHLLNKIFLDRSRSVLLILCRLVAACTTSPVPSASAEKWAELSLRRYEGVSDAELLSLYIPLLHTCVHLWWQRGRDNKALRDQLDSIEAKGISVKNAKTLTQAIHALDPRAETI